MLFSNMFGFAALLENGDVFSWGYGFHLKIQNVKNIVSTTIIFAALQENGDVFIWEIHGDQYWILEKNVKEIFSNDAAFCALDHEGHLLAWESLGYGGFVPLELEFEKNIQTIFSTETGFIALLENGTFWAWDAEDKSHAKDEHIHSRELSNMQIYLQ
jgi:alpha-tubulin suppressor-like RCC1 family protein